MVVIKRSSPKLAVMVCGRLKLNLWPRAQRVPATESQGRIDCRTAAVMPELPDAEPPDINL